MQALTFDLGDQFSCEMDVGLLIQANRAKIRNKIDVYSANQINASFGITKTRAGPVMMKDSKICKGMPFAITFV